MAVFNIVLKQKNKRGTSPLYVAFYIKTKKIEIPVKLSIKKTDFDVKKQCIKLSSEFSKDGNLIINTIKSKANEILVKYRLRNKEITPDIFWVEYRNPSDYTDFFSFCKQSQKIRFKEIEPGTQRRHTSCIKLLKDFKETIHFDELTPDLFRKFVLYLRNVRGNREVTICKTIHTINVYLNEAVSLDYLNETPIKHLKLRGGNDTTAIALSKDEFKSVLDLYLSDILSETKQNVLEFFLFMAFTSLHIGDAKRITVDQVSDSELIYMRMKTKNSRPQYIKIPLSDPAKKIINKKKNNRTEGLLFEKLISNEKINLYLKEIATICGITKNLCAKTARHTFATLFLSATHDLNSLSNILGHSSIKFTMIYAHVLDADKKNGIATFNEFVI